VPTYTAPTKEAYRRTEEFVSTLVEVEPTPLAQKIASGICMLTADVGVLFTPITAVFVEAEKIPTLKPAVEIITAPFTIGAITGGFIADRFVDALPVSKENKDILRPALKEAGETAGMIWLGGKVMEMIKRGKEITKKDMEKIKAEMPEKVKTAEIVPPKAPEMPRVAPKVVKPTIEPFPTKKAVAPKIPTEPLAKAIPKELEPLAIEARKYKSAEEFVQGMWDRLNVAKTEIPGFQKGKKQGSVRDAHVAIRKMTGKEGAFGGWFDSFQDFYTQAVKKPVGEVAPIEAVPEVSGIKPSKIALSIETKAIEKGLTKGFKDLAGFDPIKIKEQAQMMSDIMKRDIEMAKRIATGKEPLPEGLNPVAAIKAMEDYAMEMRDGKLVAEIASSPLVAETSVAAQTLRLAAERTPDSAVTRIREVAKVREKATEKKLKGKKPSAVKAEMAKGLKEKIKQKKPTKYDWNNFIESIKC